MTKLSEGTAATRPMRLYVNIDHVATVREARRTDEPDPTVAALAAQRAGADGITFHLREDRRHVNDQDARNIVAGTRVANFELAARQEIVDLAIELKPFQVTLVPERREEVTTEGGLDLKQTDSRLPAVIERLTAAGIRVALFVDPDLDSIGRAGNLGVSAVELHTGRYALAPADPATLDDLRRGAARARELGLAVHAGHGLTYRNTTAVAAIAEIEELNIGHSIVSRAMEVGIFQATVDMKRLIESARR